MCGIKVEELIGFCEVLFIICIFIDFFVYIFIDIVGIGGDGKNIFNIFICVCFIVVGVGYYVVKYGNYGVIFVSGVSNVIE